MKYTVAGHTFSVEAPAGIMREGYMPFVTDCGDNVFKLTLVNEAVNEEGFVLEIKQNLEGQVIEAGHIGNLPAFRFGLKNQMTGTLICAEDYSENTLSLNTSDKQLAIYTIDNALMILYALSTADKNTLLVHASVTVNDGRGYLFMAPSGTGKSTHSRLWLRHISGTHLLNDDNPVLRLMPIDKATGREEAIVFGSPWSGKTPCYLNESYPIGAVVEIAQAPYNAIQKLSPLRAYSVFMASASGKRWDRKLADGLHNTLNIFAQKTPVYHLDCLPDKEAAILCSSTIRRPE